MKWSFHKRARLLTVELLACILLFGAMGCLRRSKTDQGDPRGAAAGLPPWEVVATHEFGKDNQSNFVTALTSHEGALWVGTKTNLYECRYDVQARTLQTKGHAHRIVSDGGSFEVTRLLSLEGKLWVATDSGYACLTKGGWTKEDVGRINDIARFGGALWCATNNGVEILPDSSHEWKTIDIQSATKNSHTRSILSLCTQSNSVIWLGSKFGVHRFSPTNRTEPWKRFYGDYQSPSFGGFITNEKGNCDLAGNYVYRILLSKNAKSVLFSTLSGLSILREDARWDNCVGKHIRAKSGGTGNEMVEVPGNTDLPSNEIRCSILSNKDLWIGTKRGLVLVRGKEAFCYDVTSGLPRNAITFLLSVGQGKRLFVATEYGLAVLERRS